MDGKDNLVDRFWSIVGVKSPQPEIISFCLFLSIVPINVTVRSRVNEEIFVLVITRPHFTPEKGRRHE